MVFVLVELYFFFFFLKKNHKKVFEFMSLSFFIIISFLLFLTHCMELDICNICNKEDGNHVCVQCKRIFATVEKTKAHMIRVAHFGGHHQPHLDDSTGITKATRMKRQFKMPKDVLDEAGASNNRQKRIKAKQFRNGVSFIIFTIFINFYFPIKKKRRKRKRRQIQKLT